MDFYNTSLEFSTRGNADIVEITDEVGQLLAQSGFTSGLVNIFVPGATCKDFRELFDALAPPDKDYHHNRRQVDSNGHSHVRAALLGPSLTLPFRDGRLLLGTWQQIVFLDFDEIARDRRIMVTFLGE